MGRWGWLGLAVAAIGLGDRSSPGGEASSKARPNVLFIAVDDLRPEFGAYGATYVKSPNIDKLAARGVTFDRAYCQQAVCSPSRSSIMTGMRPDSTKVYDLVTHFRAALPDAGTLPEFFKKNGYVTRGIGKIYHPGYDDSRSWSVPWETAPAPIYGTPENRKIRQKLAQEAKAAGKAADRVRAAPYESADVDDEEFVDGKVAAKAVQALREFAEKPTPFFLAVGFARPHLPFVAPKKYWDLYDPEEIRLAPNPSPPEGAPDFALVNSGELRNYHGMPKQGPIPDEEARKLKHGYYAAISYMDAQLGKVLDELDRLGRREDTIVVFWGDHGWKLGEHGAWCKHSNVELDTRVPLIVAAPGRAASGVHSRALVEFVDVYPTLADLAGLEAPKELQGLSFAPLLTAPDRPWKAAAFSQYPRPGLMGYSMRTDRYRLTRWVDRRNHADVKSVELYDLQADPGEDRNVAADPSNSEVLKTLTAQALAGWEGVRAAVAGR